MTGKQTLARRASSYGQNRNFRGLEDFAIRSRLGPAQRMFDELVTKGQNAVIDVLELGCGYWGRNLTELQRRYTGARFTGVDLSVATDTPGVQLIEADISTWRPSKEYDVVLSLAVVEHLLEPQVHFNLIASSLKKGGLAGLTTPGPQAHVALVGLSQVGFFDRPEIEDHMLYLTEDGIKRLAANSSLFIEKFQSFFLGMNQWTMMRKI